MSVKTKTRRKPNARPTLTPEEREQRRSEDREFIDTAVRQLRDSDQWRAWLDTRARFRTYSLLNTLLIHMQRPDATRVASLRTWNGLGRKVIKGEGAIAINVYCGTREVTVAAKTDGGEDETRAFNLFRLRKCLFDVSQTDGDELPGAPRLEPITGDSHADLLEPLRALVLELDCTLEIRATDSPADGWFDKTTRTVVIDEKLSLNAQVATLVHEIAHVMGIDYQSHSRPQAETLVESVAYTVCAGAGLDIAHASIPYIACWANDTDLGALRDFASDVDAVARRIEAAIHPNDTKEP